MTSVNQQETAEIIGLLKREKMKFLSFDAPDSSTRMRTFHLVKTLEDYPIKWSRHILQKLFLSLL